MFDPQGFHQVVTTDMLVEGVHFNLGYVPLKHLGYKAVVVNVSDVCAMNATPKRITVALALSNRFPVEANDELYEGMLLACKNYGVDLVGGDTCSSPSGLVISVTAIGEARKEDLVYRSGAKDNDLLVVSGDLGGAYGVKQQQISDVARAQIFNLATPVLNLFNVLLILLGIGNVVADVIGRVVNGPLGTRR